MFTFHVPLNFMLGFAEVLVVLVFLLRLVATQTRPKGLLDPKVTGDGSIVYRSIRSKNNV